MINLSSHCLSLCTHRQCIRHLVLIVLLTIFFLLLVCLCLLHHFGKTECTSRMCLIVYCLIYYGLLVEVDTVRLIPEEILAVLSISDPDHNQFLYRLSEVLPVELVVHFERINHLVFCQVEQCVAVDLVLVECILVGYKHGIGLYPSCYILNCPLSDVLVLQNERGDFTECIELLKRRPRSC